MMKYLMVWLGYHNFRAACLVVSAAVVMFAECCPTESAVSETEVLEWLNNPESSIRDLKQATRDLKWLDSPVEHFSDVRHEGNKPEDEQIPENAPLVSQGQQKSEGQVPIEEKKFDQMTHQHHDASPTPPATIQVEERPDQGPVVLEIPGAEQKPEPVLVEEKKPDEVSTPKEKKPEQVQVEEPEKVPVVSFQVPVDEPQPGQVPVENKKPEQVVFQQEQPKNPMIPEEQQKSEQAVGTETSDETLVDAVKKQVPSTTSPISVKIHTPNHGSPTRFEESGCFWSGTAPFCRGKCGKFYRAKVINKTGDGKACLIGVKKLCCPISLTSLIG